MINPYLKFDEKSKNLYEFFRRTKEEIDVALCDSIDTFPVMINLNTLLNKTSQYMIKDDTNIINVHLLNDIYEFIKRIINIFDLDYSLSADDAESNRSTEQQKSTVNVIDIA
jgi:hypothetical protein